MSQTTWSDLAPMKALSPPVVKYLVSVVAAHLANRSQFKSALATQSIAKELENEGVEWSNKKVARVCDAL